jgi:hypothetical protein
MPADLPAIRARLAEPCDLVPMSTYREDVGALLPIAEKAETLCASILLGAARLHLHPAVQRQFDDLVNALAAAQGGDRG